MRVLINNSVTRREDPQGQSKGEVVQKNEEVLIPATLPCYLLKIGLSSGYTKDEYRYQIYREC
jgi:hypothetical protein